MRIDWCIRIARPVIRRKRRAAYRYRGVVARNRWTTHYARRLAWWYSLPRWQREYLKAEQSLNAEHNVRAQRVRLREALRARGVVCATTRYSDGDRDSNWRDGLASDWNANYHASHNHR